MIRLLRNQLLLVGLTMSRLLASGPPIPVSFGDGISLTNNDGSVYLTMSPGEANAGMTSGGTDTTATVFQLSDANGNTSSANVIYGNTVSLQLASNNLWVTLDPAPGYIRNNSPVLLSWEQLQFVPVNASLGAPANYGDVVYLAHTPDQTSFVYAVINMDGSVTTTGDRDYATQLSLKQYGDFAPYSQAANSNSLATIPYTNPFMLSYSDIHGNSWWLNMNGGAINAGTLGGSATIYQMYSPNDTLNTNLSNATYGAPIYLQANGSYVTLNIPSPFSTGYVRNNVTSFTDYPHAPAWETLYFIPAPNTNVNGTSNNGDLIYYSDQAYLARNALIEGNFATEYLMVDGDLNVLTTTDFANAAILTIWGSF